MTSLCSSPSADAATTSQSRSKADDLITSTAPQGFRWEITANGKTLKFGTTATEFEAGTMADVALKEIEKKAGPF